MTDYSLMSTDDLVNWRDEGIIFDLKNQSWGLYAWAQQIIASADGTSFFMYYPAMHTRPGDKRSGTGVAVASSITGPFNDALGYPLLPCGDDPTVLRDWDGSAYLCGNCNGGALCARLAPNMTALATTPTLIKQPMWFEAPWLTKREAGGGVKEYFLSYMCAGEASGGGNPHGRGDFNHFGWDICYSSCAGAGCGPLGPFTFRGSLMWSPPGNCGTEDSATPCGAQNSTAGDNNHQGIVEFPQGSGALYLAYHTRALAYAQSAYHGFQRNVALDRLYARSDAATYPLPPGLPWVVNDTAPGVGKGLLPVTATPSWVRQLKYLDPYSRVPATLSAAMSPGMDTEACAEGGLNLGFISNGAALTLRGVDFGAAPGAAALTLRYATPVAGVSVEVVGDGRALGPRCALPATGDWQVYANASCAMGSGASGIVGNLTFAFYGPGATGLVNVLFWAFGGGAASGALPPPVAARAALRSAATGLYACPRAGDGVVVADSAAPCAWAFSDLGDGTWALQSAGGGGAAWAAQGRWLPLQLRPARPARASGCMARPWAAMPCCPQALGCLQQWGRALARPLTRAAWTRASRPAMARASSWRRAFEQGGRGWSVAPAGVNQRCCATTKSECQLSLYPNISSIYSSLACCRPMAVQRASELAPFSPLARYKALWQGFAKGPPPRVAGGTPRGRGRRGAGRASPPPAGPAAAGWPAGPPPGGGRGGGGPAVAPGSPEAGDRATSAVAQADCLLFTRRLKTHPALFRNCSHFMGNVPSEPTPDAHAALTRRRAELISRAALAVSQADCLLFTSGAGWSADSGLAVHRDVADLPAYRARGLTYRELCTPQLQLSEPDLFLGFWGLCYNTYRATAPHEGYKIVASWRDRVAAGPAAAELRAAAAAAAGAEGAGASAEAPPLSPFFCFTSNVDAHWHSACAPHEVYECHGNSELWQCADPACAQALAEAGRGDPALDRGCWRAPPGYAVHVDRESLLAPVGVEPAAPAARPVGSRQPHDAAAFASNHPACVACGGPARPNILFFDDLNWQANEHFHFERWKRAVLALCEQRQRSGDRPLAVAIVECGAGGNVTTVRRTSEALAERVAASGGAPTLVRINPELPLADRPSAAPYVLPLLSKGLAAVQGMQAEVLGGQASHAWTSPLENPASSESFFAAVEAAVEAGEGAGE